MKRKYEVIGIVIDTEKETEKCSFLSAVLDCKMENFAKITDFFGEGDRKVREYFSNLPTLKKDPLSIQAMLELAGLEMKENCGIEELTLGEKKLLLLIKLVADTSEQYILQSLFQDMEENEVQSAARVIAQMSTYENVILLSSSSEGYEICDRVIQWSGNDGKGHITRSKIKDMCIMPPFVMRDILKVIRASETAEVVIPLWEVISGEYEEYAHQVLNSNAGKKGFVYRYISHRPFRSGDIYWIMEHQLQELEVDGRPCFEKVSLMTDEATIHVTCSEYFFRCCKELETIFYHYAENHVEELKFRNECVVSGNEFNEFILRKFDYNLGRIYRPFLQYIR